MIVYVDTSVVLRHLFRQPPLLREWGRWSRAYASELLGVETRRTFDRLRLQGALDDANLARAHDELAKVQEGVGTIALSRLVLNRASLPMPTPVKTLDAIHLASALLFRETRNEEIAFATHDEKLGTAARALGFLVLGA